MASSSSRPSDLSVSTARCFNALIAFKSMLVENTFLAAMIRIIAEYNNNCNKDNLLEIIKYK